MAKETSALVCSIKSSAPKKSVQTRVLAWNREKPRPTAEYVDRKFAEPFNIVAPELRVIGGLGPIKCVRKQKQNQPLINRPTQVQKLCHTTTKLLPNFTLTEQLRPVRCRKKTKAKVAETVERVKFAENLPTPTLSPVPSETKRTFNHQNPFNLDLNALSAYQKQKHNVEEMERRKNYQIIRRTMETKALKEDGPERFKQETRDDKFKHPELFKVVETNDDGKSTTSSNFNLKRCGILSTIEKPKNREIVKRHYQHKEEKLRQRFYKKEEEDRQLAKETNELEKEKRENFVFRLAEESFAASECNANENVATMELPPTYERFDYPINESELVEFKRQLKEKSLDEIKRDKLLAPLTSNDANDKGEEIGIPCGEKMGNRVILRGFHDRFCTEPRGEKTYHHLMPKGSISCLTHSQWLDSMANDPEISKQPPRAKLLSSVKVKMSPNDEKTILFDGKSKSARKKNVAVESPIRQHIRQIDEKIKIRTTQTHPKKAKSHMCIDDESNNKRNQQSKRHQRMKFMGIPVHQTSSFESPTMKISQSNLNAIVAKFSQPSLLLLSHRISSNDKSTPECKHLNAGKAPEVALLKPKIPEFDCTAEEEREQLKLDKSFPFSKAQPRGTNARNLRIDKSLPWIEDELNATEVKLQKNIAQEKTYSDEILSMEKTTDKGIKKIDAETSGIKNTYKEIIASKIQDSNLPDNIEVEESIYESQHETQSTSTLSSAGTNFTNDSGSVLVLEDQKIPMREMNAEKKFLNQSLITAKELPLIEPNPFFIPKVEEYEMIKEMSKPKDRFHTYRTRSCANIRDRIRVDVDGYEEELFGTEAFKMVAKMATDFDESYQSEFHNERSHKTFCFKPRTMIDQLRGCVRKNMEICWIKEKMVKEKIEEIRNEEAFEETKAQLKIYEEFLTVHKEKVFRDTNRVLQEVKSFYQTTDEMRKKIEFLQGEISTKRMSILQLGDKFMRLVMYQNFQYLIKPLDWRRQHDFIHKTPEGNLESFTISIDNRPTANLWSRDNLQVFTIKNFVEENYIKKDRCSRPAFDSGKALMQGYKDLQVRSLESLISFQSFAHMLSDDDKELQDTVEKNTKIINRFTTILGNFEHADFMKKRSKEVEAMAMEMINKTLYESVSEENLRLAKANIDFIFQKTLLKNIKDGSETIYKTHVDRVKLLETQLFELLDQLDKIPVPILNHAEDEARIKRILKWRNARKCQKIEIELKQRVDQFHRLFAKPKKMQKREVKIPKKKKPKKIEVKMSVFTPLEADYARAFIELGIQDEVKFDEDVKKEVDRIKHESVPFYIDHYFEKHKIPFTEPTSKSIDQILAEEEKYFKFKDVLPQVLENVEKQSEKREKQKLEHILKTPYLYED